MYMIVKSSIQFFLFLYLFSVKYLREVTPYFRKASIISEVGWELQRGYMAEAPPSPPSPRRRRADTRYVPLLMACVAKDLRHHDPGEARHTR